MKTIGIIAEYNPFHNGHAYQIKKLKELTSADFIIIAMSGDFVQRGTPAIIDKYARANMALSCGADLVVELPVLWATSSAESFAMAGVTLFDKIGCVDSLCFGAETSNFKILSAIAEILAEEPTDFSELLSLHLKKGLSFPAARAAALLKYRLSGTDISDLEQILSSPNNILAIEYLKALKKRNSKMKPLLIKREGAAYHDASVDFSNEGPNASATAIRKILSENCTITNELSKTMPKKAFTILQDYLKVHPLIQEDDFSSILNYLLLFYSQSSSHAGTPILSSFGDSNEDIANRLIKNLHQFQSFSQFCQLSKSKDITYTRMSRILLHILLNITNSDYEKGMSIDYIPYFRLLGFKKSSTDLLSKIKITSQIPMVSKLADAANILNTDALWLLKKDIFAADLYEQVLCHKPNYASDAVTFPLKEIKTTPRSEYSRGIVLF